MKKVLLLLVAILFLGLASVYAQSSNEPIVIDKTFLGHNYYYGDTNITSVSAMKAIVSNDELALDEVKKASVASAVSSVLAYAGGFAIGWEISQLFFGKFNPYVLGGGLGAAAIGLGLSALADSHLNKGATIYNENLGVTSYGNKVELDFGLMPGGVGLTLSF